MCRFVGFALHLNEILVLPLRFGVGDCSELSSNDECAIEVGGGWGRICSKCSYRLTYCIDNCLYNYVFINYEYFSNTSL